MQTVTVFKVMSGEFIVDSFDTQVWGTVELAIEKARAKRDSYNSFNPKTPARLVRAFQNNKARPL
jgi:hypothetical protein